MNEPKPTRSVIYDGKTYDATLSNDGRWYTLAMEGRKPLVVHHCCVIDQARIDAEQAALKASRKKVQEFNAIMCAVTAGLNDTYYIRRCI